MIEPSFIGYFGDFFPANLVGRVTALTGVGDNLTSMLLMLTTGIVLDRFDLFAGSITMAGILPLLMVLNVIFVLGKVKKVIQDP